MGADAEGRSGEDRDRDWSRAAITLEPLKAGRGKSGSSLRGFWGSMALQTPALRLLPSRNVREYSSAVWSHLAYDTVVVASGTKHNRVSAFKACWGSRPRTATCVVVIM